MKLNNYFGKESEASYIAKMKGAAQSINLVSDFVDDTNQDITQPDNGTGFMGWWNGLPWYGKGAVIGGSALVVITIARR